VTEPSELIKDLSAVLEAAGFETFVKLGQGPIPDQIFVSLEPDANGRVLHLQIMLLAGMAPPVLQYFVGLPYPIVPRARQNLCRLLCQVNAALPISGFEYQEANEMLYFRHNHCVSVDPLDADVVVWSLGVAEAMIGQFGGMVEAVAGGAKLADVQEQLVQTLTTLTEG
jgi:hypothetical protein